MERSVGPWLDLILKDINKYINWSQVATTQDIFNNINPKKNRN